jgi:hypothetical protein
VRLERKAAALLAIAGLKAAQELVERLLADAKTEPQRMRAAKSCSSHSAEG